MEEHPLSGIAFFEQHSTQPLCRIRNTAAFQHLPLCHRERRRINPRMLHTQDLYARAIGSRNLRLKPVLGFDFSSTDDASVLIASGHSQQRSTLAGVVCRAMLLPHNKRIARRASSEVLALAHRLIRKQRAKDIDAERAVTAVMRTLLAPVCSGCSGVRFQIIAGTSRLSNATCYHCNGTGLMPERADTPQLQLAFERTLYIQVAERLEVFLRRMRRLLS